MSSNKIISIKQHKRTSNNCILQIVDDSGSNDSLVISMDIVLKYKLSKDREIATSELETILSEQRIIDVKRIAYSYAAYFPRTKKQIVQKLLSQGFDDKEIEITLNFLQNFNVIDDKEFARKYINDVLLKKNVGKMMVLNELIRKGIDKEIANEAINKYYPINNSWDMALAVALKKLKTISHKPLEKQKSSLYNHLISKGFHYDEARKVLEYVF
jgi:regulatory protein